MKSLQNGLLLLYRWRVSVLLFFFFLPILCIRLHTVRNMKLADVFQLNPVNHVVYI